MRGARSRAVAYAATLLRLPSLGNCDGNGRTLVQWEALVGSCDVGCVLYKRVFVEVSVSKTKKNHRGCKVQDPCVQMCKAECALCTSCFLVVTQEGGSIQMIPAVSWQGNEMDLHLSLPLYIHILMAYEDLTSRGDDSPNWAEIGCCNQPVYLL